MLNVKTSEEAVVSCGTGSPSVKQMLNSWATRKGIISKGWKDLITAILEAGPLLQWKTHWKEEARAIEQQSRAGGLTADQPGTGKVTPCHWEMP